MNSMDIHNVSEIIIGEPVKLETNHIYYTKSIIFKSKDKKWRLTFFSNNKEDLKVIKK